MPPYSEILETHQKEALDRLLCGNMRDLDPCIGDMSCQMRVPFILDMYWKAYSQIRQKGLLDCLQETISQREGVYLSSTWNHEETEENQLAALREWRHYDSLIQDIRQLLGKDNIELLGLCYSLTISNAFSYDEFGTYFYFIYLGSFGPPTHHHDSRGKLDPDNQLPLLRHKLAKGTVAHFYDIVERLDKGATWTANGVKQNGHTDDSVERQLNKAVHRLSSSIEQQHACAGNIPLIACQPQMKAVFLHEFVQGRAMAVTVRRLKISVCATKGYTYTLSDARCLYYTPNKRTGTFELVKSVDPKFRQAPCLAFNCWSTYLESQPGCGLASSSDAEYFEALARSDITWLISVYANVHPPFASKSSVTTEADLPSTYADICGGHVRDFDYTRERCHGLSLQRDDIQGDDGRPTLYEELVMANRLAQHHDFANARLIPMGARSRNCYLRINHAVDFAVEHVKASTWERASAFCWRLQMRHARAGQPVIGQCVVRIGRFGVSCTDQKFACTLSGIKKNKKKWDRYALRYKQNLGLVEQASALTL